MRETNVLQHKHPIVARKETMKKKSKKSNKYPKNNYEIENNIFIPYTLTYIFIFLHYNSNPHKKFKKKIYHFLCAASCSCCVLSDCALCQVRNQMKSFVRS